MRVRRARAGGVRHRIAALAGPPSPDEMPFSHSARQAEPLLPLAVFLLVPLLLAAGVRRHTVQSVPVVKSATAPELAAPLLPSAGGTRGR